MTLGRILVELYLKTSEFPQEDLEKCFWFLWVPLVKPALINIEGKATLSVLSRASKVDLKNSWKETFMPELLAHMTFHAFNIIPGTTMGSRKSENVEKHLILKNLLQSIKTIIGPEFIDYHPDNQGFEIVSLSSSNLVSGEGSAQLDFYREILEYLVDYLSPNQKKFQPLEKYAAALGQNDLERVRQLRESIIKSNLRTELQAFEKVPNQF